MLGGETGKYRVTEAKRGQNFKKRSMSEVTDKPRRMRTEYCFRVLTGKRPLESWKEQ